MKGIITSDTLEYKTNNNNYNKNNINELNKLLKVEDEEDASTPDTMYKVTIVEKTGLAFRFTGIKVAIWHSF